MALTDTYIKTNCIDCKCKSGPFKRLTDEQMRKVDKNRTELTYKKGEIMCKQGTFVSSLIFVRKGFVKVFLENGDDPTIISVVKSGAFIGLQSLYGENIFHYSAEAMTDTEICLTDINTFRELILENSNFAKGIIETLNGDLISSYSRLFSLTQKHINGRFAELLLFMSQTLYADNPFKLTISRKDMADLISTSPESVSRLMSEFKEQGIITAKGHILEILDKARLESISVRG
jgi:CRP-like cAMP-binding protein